MTKSCSAVNCSNRSNRTVNISYHRFPFRSKDLLKKWLVKLQRESFIPTVNSYVCSVHFEADSFLQGYHYKKLKDDAIPTIFNHSIKLEKCRLSPRKRQAENSQISSNDITHSKVNTEHNYSLPGSPSKLRRKLNTILKRKDNVISKNNIKIAALQKKSKLQEHKISCMQDLISKLQDENLLCEKTNETLENFSAVQKEIFNRLNGPKNAQYSNILKSFSLTLHFHSPAAYQFVREKLDLCLPHQNTLRGWVNTVDGNPGFTEEAFIALKNRINSVSYPVYVAVTFDEMSIKKQIDWEGKQMIGNVNYGPNIDVNTTEAGEALVVMVVALNCWWKIPIGYFLVRGVSSDEKMCIVRRALEMLHSVGAHCVSITFDGLAANISMANKLGADLKPTQDMKAWFPHPITGNKVFIILDACHVFKNIRNLLCEKEVLIDEGGNAIKWSFLKELEELQKMEGLRLANKLTDRHINYQFQKMKVNLAVQVISRSCATAIKYLSEDLKHPAFFDSAATVEFLMVFDHFFDLCNSRNPFANGTKSAMRENNHEINQTLIGKVENYALNLKLEDGTPVSRSFRKVVVIGILSLCKSMLGLYDEMIRSKKLPYLLTYKLSQDAVELFFNKIRSRLGWNNNPTAKEFKAAYKRLLIANEVKCKTTGNCIPQKDIPLLSWEGVTQKSPMGEVNENQEIILDDLSDHSYCTYNSTHLSEFSKNAVVYIAGYVVRSIRSRLQCHHCLNALYGTGEIKYGDFINKKNNGGLVVPSHNVVKVCEVTERVIRQYSNRIFTMKNSSNTIVNNVLRNTESCFRELQNHDLEVSEFPNSHLSNLIKEVAKSYLKIKCNHLAKEKSLSIHKKQLRQHLTKSVLFMNQ